MLDAPRRYVPQLSRYNVGIRQREPRGPVVRLLSPAGRSRIILSETSTMEDLRAKVQVCTRVAGHSQRLAFYSQGSSPVPFTSGALVTTVACRSW